MLPKINPPKIISWKCAMTDDAWEQKINDFFKNISFNQNPITSFAYPRAVLLNIESIYKNLDYDYNT